MTGSDYDHEVARQAVGKSTKQGHAPAHTHCGHKNEKAYHHHHQKIGRSRQPESVHSVEPAEQIARRIRRIDLEIGHTAEKRVGPPRGLASSGLPQLRLVPYGGSLLHVGLTEYITLQRIAAEKSHGYGGTYCHGHNESPRLRSSEPSGQNADIEF